MLLDILVRSAQDGLPLPESTIAGIITAIATVLIALGGVITAVTLLIPILRETRDNKKKIDEVHTIVNQQRTDMEQYTRALIRALKAAHVEVPIDQSLPDDKIASIQTTLDVTAPAQGEGP